MVEFVQRFHAVHGTDHAGRAINHAFTTTSAVNAPQDSLRASVVELTAAVAALTATQKLSDEKSLQAPPQPPRLMKPTPTRGRTAQRWRDVDSRQRRGVRCFNCNQFGHYARSCPWDTQCGLCFGWGHRQDQCANNYVFNGPTNCQSLPTTSTVTQLLRTMGCAEMDSCKTSLTTDRNATFAKNSDFSKGAFNMFA